MNNSVSNKVRGSIALDSLIAVGLLGGFLTWLVIFNLNNQRAKNAKVLATQTDAYARVFAQYLYNNQAGLINQIPRGGSITLSSKDVGQKWPADLAKTNMYGQSPCVTIEKNANSGYLWAIMYYVGGKTDFGKYRTQLVNDASVLLGNKSGVLLDLSVKGNSGWEINPSSGFLSDVVQCGVELANVSVAVNINLLVNWNQNIQQYTSITKAIDKGGSNQNSLPGHMTNTNTSKANLNLAANKGIILDNINPSNPVILKNIDGVGASTLSVSGANITALEANSIQPNQQGRVGDPCLLQEIGKTIIDQGISSSEAYQYLARSTLVCTQNAMLCANVDVTQTCYLPSIANSIVFQNNNTGVQDNTGKFICPTEVPFASTATTSISDSSVIQPVFATLSGYTVVIGYSLTTTAAWIMQVTCSNMPLYQEN